MPAQSEVNNLEKLLEVLEVSSLEVTEHVTCSLILLQDLAKYINEVKRDYETMKAIEDLEQNITEYRVSFIHVALSQSW